MRHLHHPAWCSWGRHVGTKPDGLHVCEQKKAAALYTQAGDYQKTARFYYKKAEDTYYQVPSVALDDAVHQDRNCCDEFSYVHVRCLRMLSAPRKCAHIFLHLQSRFSSACVHERSQGKIHNAAHVVVVNLGDTHEKTCIARHNEPLPTLTRAHTNNHAHRKIGQQLGLVRRLAPCARSVGLLLLPQQVKGASKCANLGQSRWKVLDVGQLIQQSLFNGQMGYARRIHWPWLHPRRDAHVRFRGTPMHELSGDATVGDSERRVVVAWGCSRSRIASMNIL